MYYFDKNDIIAPQLFNIYVYTLKHRFIPRVGKKRKNGTIKIYLWRPNNKWRDRVIVLWPVKKILSIKGKNK